MISDLWASAPKVAPDIFSFDRVRPFERVNVADLLRVLPGEEAERFVVVRERLMPVRVVCAEEGV